MRRLRTERSAEQSSEAQRHQPGQPPVRNGFERVLQRRRAFVAVLLCVRELPAAAGIENHQEYAPDVHGTIIVGGEAGGSEPGSQRPDKQQQDGGQGEIETQPDQCADSLIGLLSRICVHIGISNHDFLLFLPIVRI